jgi:hypothetical protein
LGFERTVTRSPCRNGRDTTKLAPWPSECARSVPAWRPLREPVTRTVPIRDGAIPRKLIWVPGDAVRVPSGGNVVTSAAAGAAVSSAIAPPTANSNRKRYEAVGLTGAVVTTTLPAAS